MSDRELELYEAVTEYVKVHFNRAMNRGNNSTAFAMMLLQRRLSSSIEAVHLSLVTAPSTIGNIVRRNREKTC